MSFLDGPYNRTYMNRKGRDEGGGFGDFSASVTQETSPKMGALIKSLCVLAALVVAVGADHGPGGHHHGHDHDHGHHDHGT